MKEINYKESMNRIIRSHQLAMLELGVADDTITKEALEKVNKGVSRLEMLERYLDKWNNQLNTDSVNSKLTIANDIRFLVNIRDLPDRVSGKKKEKKK